MGAGGKRGRQALGENRPKLAPGWLLALPAGGEPRLGVLAPGFGLGLLMQVSGLDLFSS
jgi:hypothetical protein